MPYEKLSVLAEGAGRPVQPSPEGGIPGGLQQRARSVRGGEPRVRSCAFRREADAGEESDSRGLDGGPSGPPLGGGKRDGASRAGGDFGSSFAMAAARRRNVSASVAPTEDQSRQPPLSGGIGRVATLAVALARTISRPERCPAAGSEDAVTFADGWICKACWKSNRPQDPVCYRCKTPQDADDATVDAQRLPRKRHRPSVPRPFQMLVVGQSRSSSSAAMHGSGSAAGSSCSASWS